MNGRITDNMKDYHKNYYIENNIERLLSKAEHRVAELKILQAIKHIDDKLRILEGLNTIYPPVTEEEYALHSVDEELPCAMHIP